MINNKGYLDKLDMTKAKYNNRTYDFTMLRYLLVGILVVHCGNIQLLSIILNYFQPCLSSLTTLSKQE